MSIGSWDPTADEAAQHIHIEEDTLSRFIDLSRSGKLGDLEQLIEDHESQALSGLMHLEHSAWATATGALDEDDIRHLIRFFSVAENLPGWEAGDKSPVIPLAKILRKRGARLDKEFLKWIRSVNDNRYLPYGPL